MVNRVEPSTYIPEGGVNLHPLFSIPKEPFIHLLQYLLPKEILAFSRVNKAACRLSWEEKVWEVFSRRFHCLTVSDLSTVQCSRRRALEWDFWASEGHVGLQLVMNFGLFRSTFLGFVNNHTALFERGPGSFIGIDLLTKQKKDFSPGHPTQICESPELFLIQEDLNKLPNIALDKESVFAKLIPHHIPLIYNISPDRLQSAIGYSYGLVRVLDRTGNCTHEYYDGDFESFSFLSFFDEYLLMGGHSEQRSGFRVKVYSLTEKTNVTGWDNVETLFVHNGKIYFVRYGELRAWSAATRTEKNLWGSIKTVFLKANSLVTYLSTGQTWGFDLAKGHSYPKTLHQGTQKLRCEGPYLISQNGHPLIFMPTLAEISPSETLTVGQAKLWNDNYIVCCDTTIFLYNGSNKSSLPIENHSRFATFFADSLFLIGQDKKVYSINLNKLLEPPTCVCDIAFPVLQARVVEHYLILILEKTAHEMDWIIVIDLTSQQLFCQFDLPVPPKSLFDFVGGLLPLPPPEIVDLEEYDCYDDQPVPEPPKRQLPPRPRDPPAIQGEITGERLSLKMGMQFVQIDLGSRKVLSVEPVASELPKPYFSERERGGIFQDHFIWSLSERGLAVLDAWQNKKFLFTELLNPNIPIGNFQIVNFGKNCLLAIAERNCIYKIDLLYGHARQLRNREWQPYTHMDVFRESCVFWRYDNDKIELLYYYDKSKESNTSASFPFQTNHPHEIHCTFLDEKTILISGQRYIHSEDEEMSSIAIPEGASQIISITQKGLELRCTTDPLLITTRDYLFYSRGVGFYLYLVETGEELCLLELPKADFSLSWGRENEYFIQLNPDLEPVGYYFDEKLRTFSTKPPVSEPVVSREQIPREMTFYSPPDSPGQNIPQFNWTGTLGTLNLSICDFVFEITDPKGESDKEINFSSIFNRPISSVRQIGNKLFIESGASLFFCDQQLNISLVSSTWKNYYIFHQFLIVDNHEGFQFFKISPASTSNLPLIKVSERDPEEYYSD